MPGSHPEAHYNSPDVFAVFSESKNLNLRSGIHVLTPTSRHTTAYVHRAENVKVGGGVFATGNGRDVEHVLSALPPWWQMPSTDRQSQKDGGNRASNPKQATTSGRAGRLASGPDTFDGINHNRRGVATSSHSNEFVLDESRPIARIQVRLADDTTLMMRMNLHHTVGDIRSYINASRPNIKRLYKLKTKFPNRLLNDNNMTIQAAGLKNAVIVQILES